MSDAAGHDRHGAGGSDRREPGATVTGAPTDEAPQGQRAGAARRVDPGTGLWFEDFAPGTRIQSRGRTITQGDVSSFAGASGDFNPLHIDAVFASRTPFRKPIAHGMLVQSIATGMAYQTGVFDGTLQALAGMTIEWHAPVFPGDTIHLVLEVTGVDAAPKRRSGEILFRASVHNQEDRLVSEGQWRTRVLRRSAARPAGEKR